MRRLPPTGSSEVPLWRNCGPISSEIRPRLRQTRSGQVFQLGGATLRLATDDASLAGRFSEIYADCPGELAPDLECTVATHPSLPLVLFSSSHAFPGLAAFIAFVFQDRRVTVGARAGEWTQLLRDGVPFAATDEQRTLLLQKDEGWQSFAGNIAVNLLMRLQPRTLFFHGATCSVEGRGIMITGGKGSGKTTTAMTLASRGHALLGDEVAAIRTSTWEALPFRRALSVRMGVRGAGVERALSGADTASEIFPDGEPRIRIHASRLFPAPPTPAPLRVAFFTRRFAPEPVIEPVPRSVASLRLLQPLGCTLWNNDGNRSTIDLIRFFERTKCYYLDPGEPDATAAAIEHCLEESCP